MLLSIAMSARGFVVLTAILFGLLLVQAACGPDKSSYLQRNQHLLDSLPKMPGAAQVRVQVLPYYEERGPPLPPKLLGYKTSVVYSVPRAVTAQGVIDFYVARLKDDWQYRIEEYPFGSTGEVVPIANFTSGGATVSVVTDELVAGTLDRYELLVDHQGVR